MWPTIILQTLLSLSQLVPRVNNNSRYVVQLHSPSLSPGWFSSNLLWEIICPTTKAFPHTAQLGYGWQDNYSWVQSILTSPTPSSKESLTGPSCILFCILVLNRLRPNIQGPHTFPPGMQLSSQLFLIFKICQVCLWNDFYSSAVIYPDCNLCNYHTCLQYGNLTK